MSFPDPGSPRSRITLPAGIEPYISLNPGISILLDFKFSRFFLYLN